LSSDVRLMKEESEGSLFQWQGMLYNQCMLMSLKTNRYIGLIPGSGESYAANVPGTLPNRKDSTVFIWEIVGE
jgi:xylan 1,4-beta-xylosidase